MDYAIKLGERLLQQGLLSRDVVEEALVRQTKHGGRIGTQLFDMGVISRYTLTNLLNRHHGYPLLRSADDIHVKMNAVATFPRNFAQRFKLVPISNPAPHLVIGAMDPPPAQVLREIEVMMRKAVRVTILPESVFHQLRRDFLQMPTDFFDNHVDPSTVEERPFQEGHSQKEPRDLIVFSVAGISLAYVRRKKASEARRLGDMLVEDGIITQPDLEQAIANHQGMHLGEALLEEDLVDARSLSRYLSRHNQCATIDPYTPFKVEPEILGLLLPGTVRKFLMVPLAIYENNLLLLTPEPDNEAHLQVAERESRHAVKPVVSPLGCVRWYVDNFYPEKVKRPRV